MTSRDPKLIGFERIISVRPMDWMAQLSRMAGHMKNTAQQA